MSTPKAQTLQQRFGFMDQDLTTPTHDAIMAWLDRRADGPMLEDWLGVDDEQEWQRSAEATADRLSMKRSEAPPYPKNRLLSVIRKRWEYPVMGERKFMIGFLDMVITYHHKILSWSEQPRHSKNYVWTVVQTERLAGFEVKTTIPSLGELFRQLSIYRAHFDGPLFVVSPDARHAATIIEQGYGFIDSDVPHD